MIALLILALVAFTAGAAVGAAIAACVAYPEIRRLVEVYEIAKAWRCCHYRSPAHRADQADLAMQAVVHILVDES